MESTVQRLYREQLCKSLTGRRPKGMGMCTTYDKVPKKLFIFEYLLSLLTVENKEAGYFHSCQILNNYVYFL